MGGCIDSDYQVTPKMAQSVLDVVEAREGPKFPGWSRTNRSVTRFNTWYIFKNAGQGSEIFIHPLVARNIRREFGVDGSLCALKAPKKFYKRKLATAWKPL